MKTTIISIPSSAASEVLKSLSENNINCKYLGLDQVGKIIMELSHDATQENLIRELIQYMGKIEQLANEFTQVLKEAVKKASEESEKRLEKIIQDFRLRRKARTATN